MKNIYSLVAVICFFSQEIHSQDMIIQDPALQCSTGYYEYYRDYDGDGYGDPNMMQCLTSSQPGYVTNKNDCNDYDATLNPLTYWYRDADGDGAGNSNDWKRQCLQPSGYVRNNSDCDDTDASIITCQIVAVLPRNHSFEAGFAPWIQETGDDLDWERKSGSTTSSNTGPSAAFDGSYYIFTESSGNYSKTFDITSPLYSISSGYDFNFNYHMYGSSMGSLKMLVSTNGGSTWQQKWYMAGDKGNAWLSASVDLSEYQGIDLKIRFSAVTGSSYTSDISLDNFRFIPKTTSGCVTALSNENYVFTRVYKNKFTAPLTAPTTVDVIEEVTYFDGLGRPMQQVGIRQAAGTGCEDIVTHIGYDEFGRETKQYLPYPDANNPGTLKSGDVVLKTQTHYQSNYSSDFPGLTAASTNPFSETRFEASPLNRPMEQGAPGKDWVVNPVSDLDNTIKFDYKINSLNEVRRYTVNLTSTFQATLANPYIASSYYYPPGVLFKTITRDENWKSNQTGNIKNMTTEEFTDKQGRVVLKRSYNAGVAHDTYYVYDDYGNLTYVLPPKAEPTTTNVASSSIKRNELCYQYKYDKRNRLVEKKVPGKGWEYIVYNKLDQPILTQDEVQRNKNPKEWLFTKYDAFGRVITTGIHTYGTTTHITQAAMQAVVDNVVYKAWEEKTTSATNNYYTNQSYPTSAVEVLTLNYYDNYTFDTAGLKLNAGTLIFDDTVEYTTKGLSTGSRVKVLGQSTWITSLMHYDDKGHVIYSASNNAFLGSIDKVKQDLDFMGNILSAETTHIKGAVNIVTVDNYEYDHVNRLLKHTQKINGGALEVIANNTYDKLGQLVSKGVGNTDGNSRLQTVDYAYNVRGWLKQINNPASLGTDLFAFKLNYNTPTTGTALYNGNISQTQWRTANTDNSLKTYTYSYDALNRLTMAVDNTGKFNLGNLSNPVKYDKNGNITNLYRMGHVVDSPILANNYGFGLMDNLTYTYGNNGLDNKLMRVDDASGKAEGFKNGINGGNDYAYDPNGNLTSDLNKRIGTSTIPGIKYNHLNLPTEVMFNNSTSQLIKYTYDATGLKLRKVAGTTTTDYAGNFIYQGGNLEFFGHPEGYVEPDGSGGYDYVYQYKDHLGSVRLSYADINNNGSIEPSSEILDEKNYYPFGLEHQGYNTNVVDENNFKTYQDKELEKEFDKNTIAFGWRDYDPAIARFNKIDRFAEKYAGLSPYNFTANNPIQYSEVNGDSIKVTIRTRGDNNETITQNLYWGENSDGENSFIDVATDGAYGGNNEFVMQVTNGLKDISNSGKSGNSLVQSLARSESNVEILDSNRGNSADNNAGTYVRWNPGNENGPPDGGNNLRPSWVGLSHELAHIEDYWDGGVNNNRWFSIGNDVVPRAEIYATHIENKIRGERNLPLRTSYAVDPKGNPVGPRIITPNSRNSRYYNINGITNKNYRPIKNKQNPYKY